ncbi:MAG: hypothetical protein AB1585_15285 [Thermodesulfobacteriota bacterium]
MKTYDKSLTEVWEWKEKVYEETKALSPEEFINKIKTNADAVLFKNQINLMIISFPDKQKKVA